MPDDRRTAERRRLARRRDQSELQAAALQAAAEAEPPSGSALVPTGAPVSETPPEPKPRRGGLAAFAAQVLGQGGQKRGLRGGPETLDKARSTYLGAEWSGPADRRPKPGRITKTEI